MSEKSLIKQSDSQFVCKLCDMMNKYSHIINWDSDGEKMIVFNTEQMEQLVLPQYFRHNNFASFIRQLNMYNFHKLEKNELYENDFIYFQHDIFKKGNERNFHFIQRKKRIKEQQLSQLHFQKKNQSILEKLKDQDKLSQTTKNSIETFLEFKFTATQSSKKIKTELETVCRELKDCRSKKISHALREIKDKISQELDQQLHFSRMIDGLLERSFLQEKQNKPVFANLMGTHFYPSMLTDETYPIHDMMYDCNRMHSKPTFLPLASHCGYFRQMSFSDGSHPMFYSNPQFYSDINYGARSNNVEKKQQPQNSYEDYELSMDVMGEEELQKILNNNNNVIQGQQIVEEENLKKEEP